MTKQIEQSLSYCAEVYGQKMTPRRMQVYIALLGDYEPERLKQAFRAHMMDPDRGRFFPKPADIVAALPDLPPSPALSSVKQIEHVTREDPIEMRRQIAYFERQANDENMPSLLRSVAVRAALWWQKKLNAQEGEAG